MGKKVRIGIIGAGIMANEHMKAISQIEQAELVAVCDLSDEAIKAAVSTYSMKGYKDYNDMLDSESLDAVFVAVPQFARGNIVEKIVERGIHLFAEKPLELDLDKAKRNHELIQKAGIINSSGYCMRYAEAMVSVRNYLADKKVGMALAYRLGKNPPMPWYGTKSKSGGHLVDTATHQVDMLRYLVGDITEVYSKMKLRHLDYLENYDINDFGTTTFEFANGAIGNIVDSIAQPYNGRMEVDIMGEDFRVLMGWSKATVKEGRETVLDLAMDNYIVLDQDRRFIEAIMTGDQSIIMADYGEALKTLAVTLAANLSAESGRPVRISKDNELVLV